MRNWDEIGPWEYPFRRDKDTVFDGENWWAIWEVEEGVFAPTLHYDWEDGFGKSEGYLREIYQFCPLFDSLSDAKHHIIDACTGTESLVFSRDRMDTLRYLNLHYSRRNGIINQAEMQGHDADLTTYREERAEIAMWIAGQVQSAVSYMYAEAGSPLDWAEWKAERLAANEASMAVYREYLSTKEGAVTDE